MWALLMSQLAVLCLTSCGEGVAAAPHPLSVAHVEREQSAHCHLHWTSHEYWLLPAALRVVSHYHSFQHSEWQIEGQTHCWRANWRANWGSHWHSPLQFFSALCPPYTLHHIELSPYYKGQLCRQFVRLFCWPTDLEHPHARRSVFIETLYPIITTNPLLPSAAYLRRSAKSFDFNLRRYHKKSYGCPDYKSVDKKNLS